MFTIGDECVYVWIVKTGECLRLINQISYLTDQQSIVSIAINPHNRLQVDLFINSFDLKLIFYFSYVLEKLMEILKSGIMKMEFSFMLVFHLFFFEIMN